MARPIIAFGPAMPGWGSWHWVGEDIFHELAQYFDTTTFSAGTVPEAEVVVFIKFAPPLELIESVARRSIVVYVPVDYYGSAADIDSDAAMLRRCSLVLIHCEQLRKYFQSYVSVDYIDHHVKFVSPMQKPRRDGHAVWVGVRTNLPPLVDWVNEHPLPCELRVLTNLEQPGSGPRPAEFGFRDNLNVRIYDWSISRQIQLTADARMAIDIKGNDFRSCHKPPAKAIDFIASGVPLAMNPNSSSVEHLARMGFEISSPSDIDRWLSRRYWEETRAMGTALRELLSLRRIGLRVQENHCGASPAEDREQIIGGVSMDRFSEIMMDHFASPRNLGSIEFPDRVGVGGVPGQGPSIVLYLRVDDDVVVDAKFRASGCGVTIAAGSALTEMILNRSVADCHGITAEQLTEALGGVPPDKSHSPVLAITALRSAIEGDGQ